ncbi:3-hydroxyacyl-CoA dehydrogenase [Variovorax sp. Sphag1AA]|uniref:3-hydroxyacyl-CoA dehydrogenase n=1 Tax=Variovorax sp. Sphag1AA TaxID=2587027 RepID=UPI0017E4A1A3|nr:3-hydroxyacyl-CoA dehydrogenase [Variovorax sp. Sphag1AA]MBB3181086.1 3-hydroxybutyryl-CoA dehydrogenase [Variovorax sp. Sphag1AA]
MSLEIQKVGVVGAGAMGRGIAQVCAAAGCHVRLFDMNPEAVVRARDAVRDDLAQGVRKGRATQEDADGTLARVQLATDLVQLGDCDLVVEAIVEQLEAKQSLLRSLEAIVSQNCILATNTSSLSVTAIAAACSGPQRVAGWHFFNPVPRMRLAEIVQAPRTSTGVVNSLVELTKRVGHRAVVTSDSPGFVVNHAGRAFVTEGLKLLAERAADHTVLDAILRTCAGFRMGPFELLDLTGLDVSVPVMESIHSQYYGDDRYRPVALARTRMTAGLLGRKSKEGFYRYEDGAAPESRPQLAVDPDGLQPSVWWPTEGAETLPAEITALLPSVRRSSDPDDADLILLAPLGADLSTTVSEMAIDASKALAIDPVFSSKAGVTLMASPATASRTVQSAQRMFAAQGIPSFVVADSPGYVAPRVVSCIVNLACEMAQQGVASPTDVDAAVRLGLGYPSGPFEWGDRICPKRVLTILQGLHDTFGDQRYRPSPWLVRRANLSLPLSAPDRAA